MCSPDVILKIEITLEWKVISGCGGDKTKCDQAAIGYSKMCVTKLFHEMEKVLEERCDFQRKVL